MIDINKTTAKYLVLDLTTFEMREEENGPMEDPNILKDDKCRTTELWLRRIEPGTFMMGSPEGEFGRRDSERQHEVKLTKPFYIGAFQVTQKQYELITGENPSHFEGDTRPVESVSYYMIRGADKGSLWPSSDEVDAKSFLGKLRSRYGIVFDLPTEAQWEYACRAGSTSALNSGKSLSENEHKNMDEVGRSLENVFIYSDSNNKEKMFLGTAVVGSFLPNQWGLYDMHGNVCEWCLDWGGEYLFDDKNDEKKYLVDPKGNCNSDYRVSRGGSFDNLNYSCRSASRGGNAPDNARSIDGFRLVLNLTNE